jgi:hypothetical protein
MRVNITVNESLVQYLEPGMAADIRPVGYDRVLHGTVEKVNQYAEPTGWRQANVKEYKAFVHIDDATADLRSGMTAAVTIHCASVPNAIQVPVQAMYAHGPKFFCFVYDQGRWQAQEVKAGPTNDKFFVIQSGLKEGDQVSMNPRAYLADVSLPALPPEEIQRAVPQAPSARTAENAAKPSGEKVSAQAGNGDAQAVPGAKSPGNKPGGVEAKLQRPDRGVPVTTSATTQASTASTKSTTAGAAQ